jgi:hypothetical protein
MKKYAEPKSFREDPDFHCLTETTSFMFVDGGKPIAIKDPACRAVPTHRWRTPDVSPDHWNYRCETHVQWLKVDGLVVERI